MAGMDFLAGRRLVIFGCGYVGAAVAAQALAGGARVTALTRNEAKALVLREQGAEVVVADLASEGWHRAIPGAAEYVVNCVSSGGGGVEGYRHSYLQGMRSVLRWAETQGRVGTLVYTSSTSVYPQGGGVTVDETAPTGGHEERPRILVETETSLQEAPAACERWFILRLAGIYGPGRHHLLSQVRLGEAAGRGDHRLNLAHREDIVAAILAAFGAPTEIRSDVFNVADDAPTPKAEVVAWLAEKLALPVPRFTGEPAGGRRAVTPDRAIANAKLKAQLGWRPRFPSFREGYADVLSR
jgi:nucleoside-diphosphate-sugar epimerase